MDRPARSPLARSFERHMRAQNRSERTIATYLQGLRQAETFLRERPDRAGCTGEGERATLRPTTLEAATRSDLEAFLVVVAVTERSCRPPPSGLIPLTCNEVQHLFANLLAQPVQDLGQRLRWSAWRRRHQARARTYHYRRQAARQP